MSRQIQCHYLEITRKAIDLITPGVGTAAAAVDQDKPLTPKRPSPTPVGETDGQAVDLEQCPVKSLRRLDRHCGIELLRVGKTGEPPASDKAGHNETGTRSVPLKNGSLGTAIPANREAPGRGRSRRMETRVPYPAERSANPLERARLSGGQRLGEALRVEANDSLTADHCDRDAVESHLLQLIERDRVLADVLVGKGDLLLGKPRFHLIARPSPGGAVDNHLIRHLCCPPMLGQAGNGRSKSSECRQECQGTLDSP